MTEEDVAKLVQGAGGELVPFARFRLQDMWGLRNQGKLIEKLEAFCETNGFEYRHEQATAQFLIGLKEAPETS